MADDGFSAEIRARCPAHWPAVIEAAASRFGMKSAELVRSLVLEGMEKYGHTLILPHPDPEEERKGAVARAVLTAGRAC